MPGLNSVEVRRRRYAILLALLLASIAVQSFDVRSGAVRYLSDAFRTVLGVAILFVAFERPRERAIMAVVLVAAVAIGWARRFSSQDLDHTVSLVLHALMSIYLWGAVVAILRDIFRGASAGWRACSAPSAAIFSLATRGGRSMRSPT